MTPAFPDAAIFTGSVYHQRREPHRYHFRQPLLMLFINTAQIETFAQKFGWLARLGIISCRRQDYLPDAQRPLTAAVLAALQQCSGIRASGPVYLLAQPRQFGNAYNPATFYFICDGGARHAAHLLIEVHNTPWGERFHYAGHYAAGAATATSRMEKKQRVSPFNPLLMTYQWRYNQPRQKFFIRMRCLCDNKVHFQATLLLRRQPFTRRRLAAALLRQPFSAAFGLAAIYWHALRLWIKKTPHYLQSF